MYAYRLMNGGAEPRKTTEVVVTVTQNPRSIPRSVGAVLSGFLAVVVLSIGTDMLLQATGIFPPFSEPKKFTTPLLLVAMTYRAIYGAFGGYITALLAPRRPMVHALALGAVGLLLSVAGAFVMRDQGHAWYSLALIVLALPSAWLGGRLARR